MTVWPGVIDAEKLYDPFVVLTMQLVAEVGMVDEVVMQASEIAAPVESWTVPVMVVDCFALADGTGIGDGEGEWTGSVGSGLAVGSGAVVGATVVAGARVAVPAGVAVGLTDAAGASVGRTAGTTDGEGVGDGDDVGVTRSLPSCGSRPFSWTTADAAAARALAAAPAFPRTS